MGTPAERDLDALLEQFEAQSRVLDDVRRALDIDEMSSNDIGAGLTSEETLGFIRDAVSSPAIMLERTRVDASSEGRDGRAIRGSSGESIEANPCDSGQAVPVPNPAFEAGRMTKVIICDQHGGFSLSREGETVYLARKGKTPYFYVSAHENGHTNFDRTVRWNPGERYFVVYTLLEDVGDEPDKETLNAAEWFSGRDIKRDDPDLLAVFEELGQEAAGSHAHFKVVEIPDGVEWQIEEYDGLEWVAETHAVWS